MEENNTLIVGLSGGADSSALLHFLVTQGKDCVAAHCNFHLRGAESNRDQEAARALAQSLNVPFLVKDFDVKQRKKATGESTEMACRSLRYDWWESLIEQGIGGKIAVAHHRDDNIETMLLNLLRGSGLAGLKGMIAQQGHVVRPLLGWSKQDVLDYCHDHSLPFVTDSTNLQNDYARNKLRNIILPALEREFPGARHGLERSLNCLRDNYALFQQWTQQARLNALTSRGYDVSKTSSPQELFEILKPLGFTMEMAAAVYRSRHKSGKIFGHYLLDHGILAPYQPELQEDRVINLSDIFTLTRHQGTEFHPPVSADTLCLDTSALRGNPTWRWRSWLPGDMFQPFGMKGRRLVSDLLSDAKLALDQKTRIRLLLRNDQILWVWPLRSSAHFPVNPPAPYIQLHLPSTL